MSNWFGELPAPARGGLVAGGTLIGAFSGAFPDSLQAAGLTAGIAVAGYGLAATIWHWLSDWREKMGLAQTILLVSLALLGLGTLGAVSAGAWMLVKGTPALTLANQDAADEGPLSWIYNMWMIGGGRVPVRQMVFKGANVSQQEVEIEAADITSAINGRRAQLDIIVSTENGNEVVPLNQAELIPPGAPIDLVINFDPPLQPDEFLETWRQFFLNVRDSERSYRTKFDENFMRTYFPGAIGPRVTKKPEPEAEAEIVNDPNNRD